MKSSLLTLAIIAGLVSVPPLRAEPAAPAIPPELKLLDAFAGKWRYEFTVYPSEWNSEEKHGTGTFTCGWTLGNRFMEEAGTDSDGSSHRKIYTFDAKAGVFRAWWFHSAGIFNDSTGRWDAEKRTFVFTTPLAAGPTGTSTLHFVDDRTVEWDVIFKDDAKVYYHSGGKSVRQ
jgi:hypothetical protein